MRVYSAAEQVYCAARSSPTGPGGRVEKWRRSARQALLFVCCLLLAEQVPVGACRAFLVKPPVPQEPGGYWPLAWDWLSRLQSVCERVQSSSQQLSRSLKMSRAAASSISRSDPEYQASRSLFLRG